MKIGNKKLKIQIMKTAQILLEQSMKLQKLYMQIGNFDYKEESQSESESSDSDDDLEKQYKKMKRRVKREKE